MTATDELRRLLDDRGVEWMPSVFDPQHETFYSTENGVGFIVTEFPEIGRMSLACDMCITPEQAVAATLGAQDLRAENAKLRELVLTLAFCANDEADCDQCPMNDARCDTVQQCFCDGAATALRELGIEVDDGTE